MTIVLEILSKNTQLFTYRNDFNNDRRFAGDFPEYIIVIKNAFRKIPQEYYLFCVDFIYPIENWSDILLGILINVNR